MASPQKEKLLKKFVLENNNDDDGVDVVDDGDDDDDDVDDVCSKTVSLAPRVSLPWPSQQSSSSDRPASLW